MGVMAGNAAAPLHFRAKRRTVPKAAEARLG